MKNRSAVMATPWMWLYVCARSSSAFFVAAYRLAGESVTSSSLNGTFVLSPYTEEEDANTTFGVGEV